LKKSFIVSVAFFVTACVPLCAQEPTTVLKRRGETPELNTPTLKEVGDALYAKFNFTETSGIKLNQAMTTKLLTRKINIPEAAFLWRHDEKKTSSFCAGRATVPGLWKEEEVVCFRDNNRDGRLDSIHILGTAFGSWSELKEPIFFHEATQLAPGGGYRYELLYEGVAAGVLRLTYREFVNDMARPSFTQELTYTLDPTGQGMVAFRGARLRILQASNESVKYEVLTGIREEPSP
jgi:hypothetical protein